MTGPDFLGTAFAESVRRTPPRYPEGVEPGVTWNGSRGTAGLVTDGEPDWSEVLTRANLDPATIEVVPGTVQVRTWDAAIGNGEVRTMRYYRCEVRGKRANAPDMDELLGLVKRRPRVKPTAATGPASYVVVSTDWQLGKRGTPAIVDRIVRAADDAAARLRTLRRRHSIGTVTLPFLGDLGESCDGHYCVSAETPVLTADMRWVAAGSLQVGDSLYALTEQPYSVRGRRYELATVTAQRVEPAEVVRVTFANGESIVCTPEHPLLAHWCQEKGGVGPGKWIQAKDLTTRHAVAKMFDPWAEDTSHAAGWLAGMYDGEGHLSAGRMRHGPNILGIAQLPGPVMDRVKGLLDSMGVRYAARIQAGSGVETLRVRGGYADVLRLLGTIRPIRLLAKIGLPMAQAKEWARVVSVESAGVQPIARMSTSSRTFFAAGYASHNSMQSFEVELDYREQRRLGRRLAHYIVDTFAPLAERIVVPVVGGNHGEVRKDGKAFTSFGDNQDVEMIEGVAEACAANPGRYGHVSFVIPGNELTLTLEVGGLITAFAHGHQAKRGPTAQARLATWWSGQAMGMRPAGDARVLYTGHYHHLSIVEHGPRIHVQAPTMDNGSQWWDETVGLPSRAGMLTVVQGPDGLHDWEVL